ncbi:MAG: tetratricopeptide repeat protein [Vicinamibacterales bacterium]
MTADDGSRPEIVHALRLDPARLTGLAELLESALSLPSIDRSAFLARIRAEDSARAAELASLVDSHDAAETWLDSLAADLSADADLEVEAATARRTRVGPWRLLGLLGRGGMGAVYLAERADGQFQQQAALKLARAGFDDSHVIKRFMAERQIVAGLEHPHIARLIEGGVTDDGRPYFAMERVEGRPLVDECDRRRLSIDARLAMFLQLADAVQYSHRHLIVHRDLKPSNVLVTADGVVKLLDFGIAKLLDPNGGFDADGTLTRDRVLTPAYAAPEQIAGGAITTATDVYALGVVLYELLSGRRPFEQGDRSTRELEEDVLSKEPERPGAAVAAMAPEEARPIAAARASTPDRLTRRLHGDLDLICLTALRKEPERRYRSAEQMVEDIRRHLRGLPIAAQTDTFRYRAGKFLRRHAIGVAMTAAAMLLLGTAAVALTIQSAIAARERDKAQQVASLLVDVFEVADPSEARGAQVTAREVLDRGVTRIEKLANQPDIQGDLLAVLGRVYRNLGLYERASTITARAADLIAGVSGPSATPATEVRSRLGELQYLKGAYKEAEQTLRSVLAVQEQRNAEGAEVVATLNNLGKVLQATGRPDEAEPVLRRALDVGQKVHGPQHVDVAEALSNLGAVMFVRGRLDAAEPYFRDALAIRRAVLGEDHPLVPASLNNLATLLSRKGDLTGAEATNREALVLASRVYGPDHPRVATISNNLGLTLFARGDAAAAEGPLRDSLALRRKLLGPAHPDTAQSLANLGLVVQTLGRNDESRPLYEEALAIRRKALGPRHPLVAQTLNNLGLLSAAIGDLMTAERSYRDALAILRASLAPGHVDLAFPLVGLGRLLTSNGRAGEAEALLVEAVSVRKTHLPAGHKDLLDAERALEECRSRITTSGPPLLAR